MQLPDIILWAAYKRRRFRLLSEPSAPSSSNSVLYNTKIQTRFKN